MTGRSYVTLSRIEFAGNLQATSARMAAAKKASKKPAAKPAKKSTAKKATAKKPAREQEGRLACTVGEEQLAAGT